MTRLSLFGEIMPVSRTSTEINRTGLWGKLKPFYEESTSPCRESCPLGIDIPLFIFHLKEGDIRASKESILFENPIPGISGRVCQHFCQESCNRGEYDFVLEIRALERFVADYPLFHLPKYENSNPQRVAVVGSGPSGLSCAYFLLRLGHKVTIFERESFLGGLLINGIPSYRLPKEIVRRELSTILAFGPTIKLGSEIKAQEIFSLLDSFDYVFLAPGLCEPKRLRLKGTEKEGVYYGFEFLRGMKIIKEDIKRAVIIGGGDVAMDSARTLRRLKPDVEISIFAPENVDQLPALKENVEETKEEGIEIIGGLVPISFEGGKRLEAIVFQETDVRRNEATGELVFILRERMKEVPVDMAIICVGQVAQAEFMESDLGDKRGFISVDEWGKTRFERIYAGGDITGERASVSHALASGKKAAISIDMESKGINLSLSDLCPGSKGSVSFKKYLELEKKNLKKVIGFSDLNTYLLDKSSRIEVKREQPEKRVTDFREISRTLERGEAEKESQRCLFCGQCRKCDLCFYLCPDVSIIRREEGLYAVDQNYCKSCGICVRMCPSHVIELAEWKDGTSLG